jgi:hypothetical protein
MSCVCWRDSAIRASISYFGMFRLHPLLECLILKPINTFVRLDKDLAFAESPQRILRDGAVCRMTKLKYVPDFRQ